MRQISWRVPPNGANNYLLLQGGPEKNPLELYTCPEKPPLEFQGFFFGAEKPQPFFKKGLRFFCPEKKTLEINTPPELVPRRIYFQAYLFPRGFSAPKKKTLGIARGFFRSSRFFGCCIPRGYFRGHPVGCHILPLICTESGSPLPCKRFFADDYLTSEKFAK